MATVPLPADPDWAGQTVFTDEQSKESTVPDTAPTAKKIADVSRILGTAMNAQAKA